MSTDVQVSSLDGTTLHVTRRGSGRPVVVVHGFMGSGESMGALAGALAESHEVVCVDLRGHGASDAPLSSELYEADHLVGDLDAVIRGTGLASPAMVGYSLGGRLALTYGVRRPGAISHLAVIGSGLGIDDPRDRAQRQRVDEEWARMVETDGVDAFVDAWVAQPMIADQVEQGDEDWQRDLKRRKASSAAGLAGMLRGFGQGTMPALRGRITGLDCPLLSVVGERDRKHIAMADEMKALVPGAHTVVIDGAGHAPHLADPASVAEAVRLFIASTSP